MNDNERDSSEEQSENDNRMSDMPTDEDHQHDEPRTEQSLLEDEAEPHHARQEVEEKHGQQGTHEDHDHGDSHSDHGDMHEGHEQMFRRRFFVSTFLSIPVLLYSETLQAWLGFSMPAFPGSEWINPVFAVIVFAYGGVPFLRMAIPELRDRSPGMMTLISMAITVAFVYSLASVLFPTQSAFFWELVTTIEYTGGGTKYLVFKRPAEIASPTDRE